MNAARIDKRELVIQTAAQVIGASAGLHGPDTAIAGAGLTPAIAVGLDHISNALGWRVEHAAETLMDAAEDAGAHTDEEITKFIEGQYRMSDGKSFLPAR